MKVGESTCGRHSIEIIIWIGHHSLLQIINLILAENMTTTKQNNTYFPKQISVVVFKPLDAQVQIKGVAAGVLTQSVGGGGRESMGKVLSLRVSNSCSRSRMVAWRLRVCEVRSLQIMTRRNLRNIR